MERLTKERPEARARTAADTAEPGTPSSGGRQDATYLTKRHGPIGIPALAAALQGTPARPETIRRRTWTTLVEPKRR